MKRVVLDQFHDVSGWGAVASGQAELHISQDRGPDGAAMRLDFDFKGGGGFVVARRLLSVPLPDAYAFSFKLRGAAPRNKFEFKLVDPTGKNVWRYQQEAFDFTSDWQPLLIRSSQIEFAWGPAGGGRMTAVGAIEFVITAGPGGKGTVWIGDLQFEDRSFASQPAVTASSAASGNEPRCAVDRKRESSWRSTPSAAPQWLLIDLEEEHEYGGLIIDWDPAAPVRRFAVQASNDTATWEMLYSAPRAAGPRSYVYLPSGSSRYIRLDLDAADGQRGVGIVNVQLEPYEFSRSINEFFHNVAAGEPRGRYPKYLCRQQTYWSPVGIPNGVTRALLNEEGMVEVDEGTFSIEPFLWVDGKLITWADAAPAQQLEDEYLPIPSSVWRCGDVLLSITAFATGKSDDAVLYVRYRVEHASAASRAVRLFAVVRPFQVTPPWQSFRALGGVSPIRDITCGPDAIWVNRTKAVIPLSRPNQFGAAPFDEGITEYLEAGELPAAADVHDDFGCASGALCYDLDVAPGIAQDVYLAIPFGARADTHGAPLLPAGISGADQFDAAVREWRDTLAAVDIRLPAARAAIDTLKTAAAHILINRDGPALQPGPRRYTRSWIRDGAIMGTALLRVGCRDAMREFIRWYAPYQRDDGFVPCCVDRDGPDWLVEHDSHGQLVYAVMEDFRFTGDRAFLAEMWPSVIKAADCIEGLRKLRLTPEFQSADKRACYGLLPESASHEGYLAHPVHSYWDDFWALRGLKDAAAMAEILGDRVQARRLAALRDDFAATLYASIRTTIATRQLNYIPGSVEWADFDPTATANAIAMLDESANLPADAVNWMFEEYLAGVRKKRAGEVDWANYTAYEIRIIGALVRLGKRQSALELLDFFLSDRRPLPWNQWPEISWRDPTSPGHLGDVPHTWIGAEYILSLLSMFAFEREADQSLVIGAGLRSEWLNAAGGVQVRGLPTWYGTVNFTLQRESTGSLRLQLDGDLTMPRGKIVARPPLDRALQAVLVNGKPTRNFTADEVVIDELPADVVMTTSQVFPAHVESRSGLSVQVNANGSVRRMDHRDIILNLFLGTEVEGGPANIYLRRHGASIESIPLLGPRSPAAVRVDAHGLRLEGEWKHVRFHVSLILAQSTPAWLWHVTLENTGRTAASVDLIYAQDLALAHYGAVRMNEYYVSQYIDYTPLTHARCGTVLAVRQNLSMGGRYPWAVIGSLGHAVSFATDALQFHGLATRAGAVAEGLQAAVLPGKRQQHEHSMAVIQDAQVRLDPGARLQRGFFGWFEADHPAASSPADLTFVDQALALPEATTAPVAAAGTLFSARPILASLDLNDRDIADAFGKDLREVERDNGGVLSFFAGANRHVVLKAKELQVLRPHGHLIRSGDHLVPDEASLTSTTWMAGVFHSLVTQGHVSINRLLSTARSYLGLLRSGGQRIFVELEDGYHLLEVPSAYEMAPNGCRWLYKHRAGVIQVCSWAPVDHHALYLSIEVLTGAPCRFLIAHYVAINGDDGADAIPVHFTQDGDGVVIHPPADSDVGRRFPQGFYRIDVGEGATVERVGGDELLFVDGRSRSQPFLTVVTTKTASVHVRITGHLLPVADLPGPGRTPQYVAEQGAAEQFWNGLLGPLVLRPASEGDAADGVERLREIVPWFAHNAMIHYLAPRGLEQYSGGGWGTRDVCQGPVELLLALGTWAPLRDLLLRVFRTQNPDGDWPQWFMFFERERGIRPSDSHGDIIFWPLLALAQYLMATDDVSLLDEVVPFFHPQGDDQAEQATIWAHVERALAAIAGRLIPGTQLVAYGHGDWNDSLQPVDPAMCERLCSAWTVTLHYQTLTTLAAALQRIGRATAAQPFTEQAQRICEEFQRLLVVDGTLTGYAYFHEDGRIDYLLHPGDQTTGIRFSLLPMIHAIINGLLTVEQARTHVGHIKGHLLAVDGARMFDRPFDYHGGPQRYFQRAESSTYFGREIGIMYTHAHLRYAEAMARYGDADALFLALRQANPCDVRAVVSPARLRQANCYYSSSDAQFADRYEALSAYAKVHTGEVAFEGGWRVYSSGAGIAVRLIHECLLGIRKTASVLVVDPVIPKALDGLCADIELDGKPVQVVYRVAASGSGPTTLTLNGTALPFEREPNPYRTGGAAVPMAALRRLLSAAANTLEVHLQ